MNGLNGNAVAKVVVEEGSIGQERVPTPRHSMEA